VYADATIFFDEEAPIVTPQIFNTIDRAPNTTVVVVDDAVVRRARRQSGGGSGTASGQILLSVDVGASGSNIVSVDLFARNLNDPDSSWCVAVPPPPHPHRHSA
jgi:hypothetical protein